MSSPLSLDDYLYEDRHCRARVTLQVTWPSCQHEILQKLACIPESVQTQKAAIPNWNIRVAGGRVTKSPTHSNLWQTSPRYGTSSQAWNVKTHQTTPNCRKEVYNSVHLNSLWRLCLLLFGHVIVSAWVKATGFSHLLPFRGGDAERRVHLIIGLSASVFMLDFRFSPAHTLETVNMCVSMGVWAWVCVHLCVLYVGGCLCAGRIGRLVSWGWYNCRFFPNHWHIFQFTHLNIFCNKFSCHVRNYIWWVIAPKKGGEAKTRSRLRLK